MKQGNIDHGLLQRRRVQFALAAVAIAILAAAFLLGGFDAATQRDATSGSDTALNRSPESSSLRVGYRGEGLSAAEPRASEGSQPELGVTSLGEVPPEPNDTTVQRSPPGLPDILASMYRATEGLTFGEAELSHLALIAGDVVSLASTVAPVISQGGDVATFTILDDQSSGRITLVNNRTAGKGRPEFLIQADLPVRPGYYTGYQEDRADRCSLQMAIGVNEDGSAKHFSATSQLGFHNDARLADIMLGQQSLSTGGALRASGEGVVWTPIKLEVLRGDGGSVKFHSFFGEPVAMPGTIRRDNNVEPLASTLAALRGR